MGKYILQADLNIKDDDLIYLTDETNDPPTTVDTTVVASAITWAEGKVDAHLGVNFDLELQSDSITALVKGIAADLTEYRIWVRSKKTMPEEIRNLYLDAKAELNVLSDSELTLGAAKHSEIKSAESRSVQTQRG
jgi:phage gp36-like protein